MRAVFHCSGKVYFAMQELIMEHIGEARYSATGLINLAGI